MENLYSISECHDISFCNLDELNTTESPKYAPCGTVVPNVRAYILDDQLEQVGTREGGGGQLAVRIPPIPVYTLSPPIPPVLFRSKRLRLVASVLPRRRFYSYHSVPKCRYLFIAINQSKRSFVCPNSGVYNIVWN